MSKFTESIAKFCEKHPRLSSCISACEHAVKKPIFGCKNCGQCVLSYNAFVCCMRCPKEIRNGPCGGTRPDGHCEVYPERKCIWYLINQRSKKFGMQKKLRKYHIPVDRRLHETSAWLNMFAGKILPMKLTKDLDKDEE
ncbi:MAG: methylenetetrahydrofolate reductase C-terminal domain-containing protein [Armatimonadota bacterium]